ncbi:MAG: 4Fe-4S dicluster domain-containing protein, partial [Deltaproteobacteria bacterium]|nr:4Fe-4S dicluster domain-containing protein [Deltaproteobacteria bacterium]
MEYIGDSGSEVCDQVFAQKVKELSHSDLDRCYQCYTCTAGCPVAYAMDYYPHQIMRMVQLGVKERVLSCSTIWLCAACETCATRCPNEIELVNVMDTLREMALEEGVEVKEKEIVSMHKTFLLLVKSWGRQHEISLLVLLKMKTKEFLKDMILGMRMFLKG